MNFDRPILGILFLSLSLAGCAHRPGRPLSSAPGASSSLAELNRYENQRVLGFKPSRAFANFTPATGITVTERDASGRPTKARIRVLSENENNEIYLLSAANGWGRSLTEEDRLLPIKGTPYFEGNFKALNDGATYRLQVNGVSLLDPAAATFSSPAFLAKAGQSVNEELNSVFWDIEKPAATGPAPAVDLRGKPIVLGETEIGALVQKWPRPDGKKGPPREVDTYRFIAESGVINELKAMGYNAMEFLPFNSSADGAKWVWRYQVFGLFGPDSRFGTPEEFRAMVDAFNRAGIALVMDAVVGHYPKEGNQGVRSLGPIGPAAWKRADGKSLFGDSLSPWQTHRYDYENPNVRRFLTDSILHNLKQYRIGGVRFDNLDGIRFQPGGAIFLRELAQEIRAYQPEALLIGEMFFGENKVLSRLDKPEHLGINFRTDSEFFDWIKDSALEPKEKISMERLRLALRKPWEWGEASRMKYITSHDEAANRRDGATGAYMATMVKKAPGGSSTLAAAKTRAYGSLGMLSAPIYMDMPQLRLLQEGNFSEASAIDWRLKRFKLSGQTNDYFSALSAFVASNPAFAFRNMIPDVENHVDDDNKVVSLKRVDRETGKEIYAVINFGGKRLKNYAFGVDTAEKMFLAIDSDDHRFGGSGRAEKALPEGYVVPGADGWHERAHSLTLPYLAPYGVLVLETR
ncbi:MAG: hypothetical protein EOP11_02460 [Proteobacteria bacterium]|nr:MAG: hypothetical protein EOP11_02460 [Pseudomonadota bacterium]